jgi:cyclomaltodextrinase / maltogenic alpha-amylase / neopullulanase
MTDQTGIGDFIFGTLATDKDRIDAVKNLRAGLSPISLEMIDGTARLTLTAGPDAPVEEVILYYSTDGSDPLPNTPGTHERAFTEGRPVWDTLVWGYLRRFEATIPASVLTEDTILRYRAEGYSRGGRIYQADKGQRYTTLCKRYPIPDWAREAIIYQIFVDRFATTGGVPFKAEEDYSKFLGGTLRGIIEKLDYLTDLGVNCLWLTPIFSSPSHHGYDATDFREIEPRLGTKADLKELVEKAHARNMRVLLDFVPNHISNEHPFFRDAATLPDSPYRNYFRFTTWPDEYQTFFGVKTLPQINNDDPAARRYVIESAEYWMREFAIDGYRLDYAYGPSHDFWADYYVGVKTLDPQSWHFGEIVETPELLASYEGRMDGALDFHFLAAVRKAFAYDTMTVEQFDDWLTRHHTFFSNKRFTLPIFLDNHDLNRFLWAAKGDKRRLRLAALLQFTLPPPPILYYGTETGLSQRRDIRQGQFAIMEESRAPMNWDSIDQDLLAYYKKLIQVRREISDALTGSRTTLMADGETGRYGYGYYANAGGKFEGELCVMVLLNNAPEASRLSLDASGTWRDLFTGETFPPGKPLAIRFEPYGGAVLMRID